MSLTAILWLRLRLRLALWRLLAIKSMCRALGRFADWLSPPAPR